MHAPRTAFQHTGSDYESAFQQPLAEVMAAGAWQPMLAMMGANMAESVRQALDGLSELARSRRIGKHEARWMREPLQQLYQTGIAAQRLSRLAGRNRPPAHEAIPLDDVVRDTLAHHQQARPAHRIQSHLDQVDVMSEPESVASVADSLLGWGCALGRDLEVQLVHQPMSKRAALTLRVGNLYGVDTGGNGEPHLDSVEWLLLWQLARLEGIKVWRSVVPGQVRAMLEFDRVMQRHAGLAVLESEPDAQDGGEPGVTAVWCVAAPGTPAAMLAATLTPHLPAARLVDSVAVLNAELPNTPDCVLSTREILHADSFRQWRERAQDLRGRSVAVIEISAEDGVFEIGDFGPDSMGRISAGALTPKLLSAIVSEMGRLTEPV